MKQRIQGFWKAAGLILLMSGMYCGAVDVKIAWDPSSVDVNGQPLEGDITYFLVVSDVLGGGLEVVDAGSNTEATVTGLEYNKTYSFKAMAHTSAGYSDYSEELSWNSPVMLDEDADQLSDSWELQYFSQLDLAHELTDLDGDGTLDVDEFVAGTNPADPDEYPAVEIAVDANGAAVTFLARQASGDGYENRSRYYTLMQCEDLTEGAWTAVAGLEDIAAENQSVSREVASAGSSVYYRTEIRLD